jgi:hypothetical protein
MKYSRRRPGIEGKRDVPSRREKWKARVTRLDATDDYYYSGKDVAAIRDACAGA